MALTRIKCPECGAGLKSPTGFTLGEAVECPKCETSFTAEEPAYEELPSETAKKPARAMPSRADDDDDDQPRKKRSRRDDDDDDDDEPRRSYKNSPARYAVLGVLVIVMIVLGVMLVLKKMGERDVAKANSEDDPPVIADPPPGPPKNFVPPKIVQGPGIAGKGPTNPPPLGPPPPIPGKNPMNPPPFNPPPMNGGGEPIGGFLGGMPALGTPQGDEYMGKLKAKLVGVWEGTLGGSKHRVEYKANGKYTHTITGGPKDSSNGGDWVAIKFVGNKGLKINRGFGPLTIIFEDDELLHDTGNPGEIVVLRKK